MNKTIKIEKIEKVETFFMIHWGNIQKPCFRANLNRTWAHVMWILEFEMIKSYYMQFVCTHVYLRECSTYYNRNTG